MNSKKIKRIGLILFAVLMAAVEFGLEIGQAGRRTGWVIALFIAFAVLDLFWDIRKISKQAKQEDDPEENMDLDYSFGSRATTGALSMLDKGLHKINPDYDPEAERNARQVNPGAIAKLDEMKKAGLIDEAEYQKRKSDILAGK